MDTRDVHDDTQWPYILSLLPSGLDESARRSQALRRCRGVPGAEALVRLLLAYGVTDLPLKSVAAWANAMGLATLSGPALFYRVRDSETWLSELLAAVLADEVQPASAKGLRLRAVDATVINGPGSKGTEWRAHVMADTATGRICAVELTDEHGGEGYQRYPAQPGDIVLGDRGYSHARGIEAIRACDAHVVVRVNPQALRLCSTRREVINLRSRAAQVPPTGAVGWEFELPIPPEKRTKSKKSWKLSSAVGWERVHVSAARTREGKVIWVLTTLPSGCLTDADVLDLYRLRWQIELLFKRLKSLLDLDALPSRRGPTARSWILARFLAAALAQKLVDPTGALSPWGYVLRSG